MFVIVVYGYHSGLALEQVGTVGVNPECTFCITGA